MTHPVLVKKMYQNARLPTRGSDGSAGWDIYALIVVLDAANACATIHTGLQVAFPDTVAMCLFARSGLGSNFGLVPANGTGIIDSDYRGEIMIKFRNLSPAAFRRLEEMREKALIGEPERVVQALFLPVVAVTMTQTEELPETVRGAGGFGSTG